MSTPRITMSTPRFVLPCLTSTCPPSSRLRTHAPLYSFPFFYCPSGPLYPRDSPVPPRRLCLRPDGAFQAETLISTTKTNISTPKSLRLLVYIYSREASGNFDFRVFIVFLRSASDPRGVDACRVFPSYAP